MQNKKLLLIIITLVVVAGAVGAYVLFRPIPPSNIVLTASPAPQETVPEVETTAVNTNPESPITSAVLSDLPSESVATLGTNKAVFTSDTPSIYATALLAPSVEDQKLVLKITLKSDDSELGPVSSTIKTENEQKYATFKMTRPETGWPTGDYVAHFVLSSGSELEVPFIIQ